VTNRSGTVVLGVGNLLMADEGVGVRTIEALEASRRLPADVRVIDGGTSTHELLGDLENLELLVIVDAVASQESPGSIVYLEGDQIPSEFSNRLSPHQHGINDLLAKLRLLGRAPARLALLGVVPQRIQLGLELSPVVAAAVPVVCDRVVELVAGAPS
jgi:hydrogenase maturation protease